MHTKHRTDLDAAADTALTLVKAAILPKTENPEPPAPAALRKEALDQIIRPSPGRREECATRIARALHHVRDAKTWTPSTPTETAEQFRKAAKALLMLNAAITDNAAVLWHDFPREEFNRRRKSFEKLANALDPAGPPRQPIRRGDYARWTAVDDAYHLLVDFGHTPTRTRGKAWHALANLLYEEGVDLFETIRDHHKFLAFGLYRHD
jgi:hypothetical protein